MSRPKGSKNKPKDDKETGPVSGLSIAASIAQSLSKFAKAEPPFDKKPELRYVDPVSPEVAVAIHNQEHPEQHTETYEVPLPKNWNEMGKIDRLKWLTEHRK